MALPKLFQRIFWHNNTTPAINEDNLNAMSKAIDDLDNRVIVLGDDVITVIPQIQAYLEQAEDLVEAMELLSENPPYIGQNGNWWVWDTNTSTFVDSGVDASISVSIADITMLAPNATPYVTNSGTDTDPIFHLFIPRGQTGNGISTIAKTGTSGLVDTYTITMTDGTTSTFTVTNGAGDMNKSVYDSDNTVANAGGIKDFVNGEVEDVYEVMGQNGAKNHIFVNLEDAKEVNTTVQPNKGSWSGDKWTYVGLSHTVNDGEITISGTQTGSPVSFYFSDSSTWGLVNGETYVISANASGELNANHYYEQLRLTKDGTQVAGVDVADETITFTYDSSSVYKLGIINRQANVSHNYTVKPMICPKSMYDFDPTYQPYAETNQQLTEKTDGLWDNMMDCGAVNYLPNNGTTQTINGVTFTVNADKTITANGTATANTAFEFYLCSGKEAFVGKEVILSGCPEGGSSNTYNLSAYRASTVDGSGGTQQDFGSGIKFTFANNGSGTKSRVYIFIQSGQTISNLVFKPMLSLASLNLSYDDFVPYAMNNRELTDFNTTKDLTAQITNVNQKMTNPNYFLVRYGNVCSLRLFVGDASNVTAWTEALLTIPSDCKPKGDIYMADANASGKCILIRAASGDVNVIQGSETLHSAQFFCTWVVL